MTCNKSYGVWLVPEDDICLRDKVIASVYGITAKNYWSWTRPTNLEKCGFTPIFIPVAHSRTLENAKRLASDIRSHCPDIKGRVLGKPMKDGGLLSNKYAGHIALGYSCYIDCFPTIVSLAKGVPFSQSFTAFAPVAYTRGLCETNLWHRAKTDEYRWRVVVSDLRSTDPYMHRYLTL